MCHNNKWIVKDKKATRDMEAAERTELD